MQKLQPLLLATLVLTLLTGCGFHLRGSVGEVPPEWRVLNLQASSPNGELANAVNNGFTAAGVKLVPRDEGNYIIFIGNERFKRSNLTVGADARASEFELIMSTTLSVRDKEGNELLSPTEIKTYKVMTNNINNVTGKVEEMRLLQREMRRDLATGILRRVRFLASNNGSV